MNRVGFWPFLKQLARNKMIFPFSELGENNIFLGTFGKILPLHHYMKF
jgi:hypothetical protein